MDKVYLKAGAENTDGKRLNTKAEYTVLHKTETHSYLTDGYHSHLVNNKHIKLKPRSI